MSSEPPKPGSIPGWGQPPDASPTEPVPPAVPAEPAAAPGTGWGQPPAPAPAPAAAPAPAGTGWGQQPGQAPQPPSAPVAPAPAPAPPAGPPQAPVQQAPIPQGPPPSGGGWGAAPAPGVVPGVAGGAGAPPNWNPQPVAKSGMNGCLKACLIIGVLLVIAFVVIGAVLVFIGGQIVKSVPIDSQGNLAPCAIVSDEKLSSVLGPGTQAIPLEGIFDTLLGLVLDKRVIPDAEDCFISADKGNSGTGRIARYVGSDAAARFQQEKQNAQPTSQDKGNGLTVENPGYFGGDVSGVGDEAFCTDDSEAFMSGVLVRQGDTLVYVSLLGGAGFGSSSSETSCELAQKVAKIILQ